MARTVKVAVVGSGLAGLTAAYALSERDEFEVHVFEKASSLGMDAHSVSLAGQRVDVPMRSFQGGYYPSLIALYKHLGVQFKKHDFSYSFSTGAGTALLYNGHSGLAGVSMPASLRPRPVSSASLGKLALPATLAAHARAYAEFLFSALLLLLLYVRVLLHALPLRVPPALTWALPIPARPPPSTTLREWTEQTTPRSALARWLSLDRHWRSFVSDVLVPLFSAVCTASEDHVWDGPVEELLDYVHLTFLTHHYVVVNGVRDVVHRITASLPRARIHLSSPIAALAFDAPSRTVSIRCLSGVAHTGFHHVVLATQANHAGPLLATYLDTLPSASASASKATASHRTTIAAQVDCLARFAYCKTAVVNHTDAALLPPHPHDVRDLNLVRSPNSMSAPRPAKLEHTYLLPPTYTTATHVLPRANPTAARIFQTTNPVVPPRQDAILSVAVLERAVVTVEGKRALAGLWRERRGLREAEQEQEKEKERPKDGRRWGWGCAGRDGGVLGPLQGAGRLARRRRSAPQEEEEDDVLPGIWICGSYAHCGIPLLEGCVVSARNVVEQGVWASEGLEGAEVPW